jgi:serine/threonine protein kinase
VVNHSGAGTITHLAPGAHQRAPPARAPPGPPLPAHLPGPMPPPPRLTPPPPPPLPPELFTAGSKITTAVDVYAFGIMMWEIYTGKRSYAGLSREAIMDRVLVRGARPAFPAGAPPAYAALAQACWAHCPAERPPFSEVVARLQDMADGMAAEAEAAAAAMAAASPAGSARRRDGSGGRF